MLRFVARHGLVRLIGGRAVPVMLVWDVAVLANKARQIPVVERGLRRGAGAARRSLTTVIEAPRWPGRPSLPGRPGLPTLRRRPRPLWTPEPDPDPDA